MLRMRSHTRCHTLPLHMLHLLGGLRLKQLHTLSETCFVHHRAKLAEEQIGMKHILNDAQTQSLAQPIHPLTNESFLPFQLLQVLVSLFLEQRATSSTICLILASPPNPVFSTLRYSVLAFSSAFLFKLPPELLQTKLPNATELGIPPHFLPSRVPRFRSPNPT